MACWWPYLQGSTFITFSWDSKKFSSNYFDQDFLSKVTYSHAASIIPNAMGSAKSASQWAMQAMQVMQAM